MRFTVTWHSFAEAELAEIWMDARDRAVISEAANEIDRTLATEPLSKGEVFYGDRLLVVLPLAIVYTINDQDRTVQVLQVWHQ